MCEVVKEAIEDQTKIQHELRIKFMDFIVDEGILNYIDPPREKLPAMEQKIDDRFNIPQLEALVEELRIVSSPEGKILSRNVVDILVRKLETSRAFADLGGLPKVWDGLTRADFEKMVRNLDPSSEGSVDFRMLCTCFVLLRSSFPSKDEVTAFLKKQKETTIVDRAQFLQTGLWFDSSER